MKLNKNVETIILNILIKTLKTKLTLKDIKKKKFDQFKKWDSLVAINFAIKLNQKFKIDLKITDIYKHNSLLKLKTEIEKLSLKKK